MTKRVVKYLGDVPPKWFNVMTIVLVVIVFALLAWTILNMFGCADPLVEYAKFQNPKCVAVKVADKPCGTEVVLQCPFARFKTICLSKNK